MQQTSYNLLCISEALFTQDQFYLETSCVLELLSLVLMSLLLSSSPYYMCEVLSYILYTNFFYFAYLARFLLIISTEGL